MNAVVNVLSVYVFMLYRGTTLPFAIVWRIDSFISLYVIQPAKNEGGIE